ncbi:MAG TPA: hypothetical protein VMM58_06535 [Bacteroidota bacterium]|nr:hypothetical protein [Bacteroidota bacterium]
MNKSFGIFVSAALFLAVSFIQTSNAQFKRSTNEEANVSDSFIRPQTNSDFLGFFNPNNFTMNQSYSMSYATAGGQGLALAAYTNSMLYKFSHQVDARVDITLQHSPYSTFDQRLQNSLSGVFLNRAEVNYRPSDNLLFRISYEKMPYGFYGMYPPY